MSAKELKKALRDFVKTYKSDLLDVGCFGFNYDEGEPKDEFQLVTLGSIKIGPKNFPVELWADTCNPEGEVRFCFSVDFVDGMKSKNFLEYVKSKNIPIYLFNPQYRKYKIEHFNTLIAEYISENENSGNVIPLKIAKGLDEDEIEKLSKGKKSWGFISYYFDKRIDGAICAIKKFFEIILPTLDEFNLDDTTRKAVVDARIGHGKYKDDMMKKWGNACAVTGCSTKEILIASHAKPWAKCDTAHERISDDNGLILTANLDAFFDKGLITFTDGGEIKISKKVKKKDWKCLGLSEELKLRKSLNPAQKSFMKYHRENVWLDRRK